MSISLSSNDPRIGYTVAESVEQSVFNVPFAYFNDEDLVVSVDGVTQSLGSDYTLVGGSGSTGTLTFVEPVLGASGGSEVVIYRSIAIERTSDFNPAADINRAALNEQLDILTAIAADNQDRINRTVRIAYDNLDESGLTLPDADERAGKYLAFGVSGQIVMTPGTESATPISSFMATVVDDADAAAARTTLGLAIGTDVQAYDAGLQSIAGLTTAADKMIYTTASDTYAVADISSTGRSVVAAASVSALQDVVNVSARAWETQSISSAVATVVFDNTNGLFTYVEEFNPDYIAIGYRSLLPSLDGDTLRARFSTDGGSTWLSTAGDYIGTSSGVLTPGTFDSITIGTFIGNDTMEGVWSGNISLFVGIGANQNWRYSTSCLRVRSDVAGTLSNFSNAGYVNTTSAINAIQLYWDSGGNFTSGAFYAERYKQTGNF